MPTVKLPLKLHVMHVPVIVASGENASAAE